MKAVILIPMALFACAANAETLFPMPSVPDVTDGDGWAFAIGAEIEYEAEYDGSDDYGVEAGEASFSLDLVSVDRRYGLTIDPDQFHWIRGAFCGHTTMHSAQPTQIPLSMRAFPPFKLMALTWHH